MQAGCRFANALHTYNHLQAELTMSATCTCFDTTHHRSASKACVVFTVRTSQELAGLVALPSQGSPELS